MAAPTTGVRSVVSGKPSPAPRGRFVTFEGGEGTGKSTQLTRLADRLRDELGGGAGAVVAAVVTLREPGGTAVGEEIRALLKSAAHGGGGNKEEGTTATAVMCAETELLLFAASRAQLVRERLGPALDAGKIVLCDRFTDSTLAYQGAARRLDAGTVAAVSRFAAAGLRPDRTFLFDLPVEVARARLAQRTRTDAALAADRLDAESDAFFGRVRDGYRRLAEAEPDRFVVLDADRPADLIAADVWRRFLELFPDGLPARPRV